VRHTRAIARDRTKRPTVAPPAADIGRLLAQVIQPAVFTQMALYFDMGLRERILNLLVMTAVVLSMLWRQIPTVAELVRVLDKEGILWAKATKVSQQGMSQRLRVIPARLFHGILEAVLPVMHQRWQERTRPLPQPVAWAKRHFTDILAVDGSTLDVILRKVGLLREGEGPVLAGKMAALLDVVSQLPRRIWYEEDSQISDQRFWERVIEQLRPGTLLLVDLGFTNYPIFDRLTAAGASFITRVKVNAAYQPVRILGKTNIYCDQIIRLGTKGKQCAHEMRLVEWLHQGKWYRYLTNVLDHEVLPAGYVVALYWQRWRVEDAFNAVKRLLGLAYFWAGSNNAVQVQVWATWLLYAVLVDLTDAVAERMHVPSRDVSLEMVYRGLYHYTQAYQRGEADDPVEFLAANAKLLGVLKRKRRPPPEELLCLTVSQTA
jgi:hypothetical protein